MVMVSKIMQLIKSTIIAYVVTGILLAAIAYGIYRWEIGEQVVNILIMAVYVIASMVGGVIVGKRVKEHRFVWGILLGALYIGILYCTSYVVAQTSDMVSQIQPATILLCIAGGMIGSIA